MTNLIVYSKGCPRCASKDRALWERLRRPCEGPRTVYDLDDPETMALVEADPSQLVRGDKPVFIDEWQRYPPSWDLVRRAVDRGSGPGSFILAGSTSPQTAPTHSGAGRIVTLRMRPMSLLERGVASPAVSLAELLAGGRPDISGETDTTLDRYALEIRSIRLPGHTFGGLSGAAKFARRLLGSSYRSRSVVDGA